MYFLCNTYIRYKFTYIHTCICNTILSSLYTYNIYMYVYITMFKVKIKLNLINIFMSMYMYLYIYKSYKTYYIN